MLETPASFLFSPAPLGSPDSQSRQLGGGRYAQSSQAAFALNEDPQRKHKELEEEEEEEEARSSRKRYWWYWC